MQNESIKRHYLHLHNKIVTRRELVDNTKIIERTNNRRKLLVKEARLIQQKESIINKKFDCFLNTLKLYAKYRELSTSIKPK